MDVFINQNHRILIKHPYVLSHVCLPSLATNSHAVSVRGGSKLKSHFVYIYIYIQTHTHTYACVYAQPTYKCECGRVHATYCYIKHSFVDETLMGI